MIRFLLSTYPLLLDLQRYLMPHINVNCRYPEARGVCKGSGDNIFCGISMGIDLRARMGLVGANGAGKSTLLKLLLGNLQPTKVTSYADSKPVYLPLVCICRHRFLDLFPSCVNLTVSIATFLGAIFTQMSMSCSSGPCGCILYCLYGVCLGLAWIKGVPSPGWRIAALMPGVLIAYMKVDNMHLGTVSRTVTPSRAALQ